MSYTKEHHHDTLMTATEEDLRIATDMYTDWGPDFGVSYYVSTPPPITQAVIPTECERDQIKISTMFGTITLDRKTFNDQVDRLLSQCVPFVETVEDARTYIKEYVRGVLESHLTNWPHDFGHCKAALESADRKARNDRRELPSCL